MAKIPTLPRADLEEKKRQLRIKAAKHNPQYPDRWNGREWTLVEILEDIDTKDETIFWEGERALAKVFKGRVWLAYSISCQRDEVIGFDKAAEVKIQ